MKFFSKETSYMRKRMDCNKKEKKKNRIPTGGSNELEFAIALDITITRSHTRGERKTNTNFRQEDEKWLGIFRPWCRKIVFFYYEILSYAIIHIYSRIKPTLCSEYTYTYYSRPSFLFVLLLLLELFCLFFFFLLAICGHQPKREGHLKMFSFQKTWIANRKEFLYQRIIYPNLFWGVVGLYELKWDDTAEQPFTYRMRKRNDTFKK